MRGVEPVHDKERHAIISICRLPCQWAAAAHNRVSCMISLVVLQQSASFSRTNCWVELLLQLCGTRPDGAAASAASNGTAGYGCRCRRRRQRRPGGRGGLDRGARNGIAFIVKRFHSLDRVVREVLGAADHRRRRAGPGRPLAVPKARADLVVRQTSILLCRCCSVCDDLQARLGASLRLGASKRLHKPAGTELNVLCWEERKQEAQREVQQAWEVRKQAAQHGSASAVDYLPAKLFFLHGLRAAQEPVTWPQTHTPKPPAHSETRCKICWWLLVGCGWSSPWSSFTTCTRQLLFSHTATQAAVRRACSSR